MFIVKKNVVGKGQELPQHIFFCERQSVHSKKNVVPFLGKGQALPKYIFFCERVKFLTTWKLDTGWVFVMELPQHVHYNVLVVVLGI